MPPQRRHFATTLTLIVGVVACHRPLPPSPAPAPSVAPASTRALVILRNDWRATATMRRLDSLVLTLPDGSQQIQRAGRLARFTIEIGANNAFSATLDTLALQPPADAAVAAAVGIRWTGRLTGAGQLEGMKISRTSALGEDLTSMVRSLIPAVPFGGVAVGRTWKDTTSGAVQVGIFQVSERRVRSWAAGEPTEQNGLGVYPVRVREEFEQLGRGSQSGREMKVTTQGSRTGNYYVTVDGRVDGAVLQDSVAQFITIPATRQTIPTMRYSLTTLRFSASRRGSRP